MVGAAEEVLGRPLPLEAKHRGLDEVRDQDLLVQLDLEGLRETARCEGYLQRLKVWEEAKGLEVVPCGMMQRKVKQGV